MKYDELPKTTDSSKLISIFYPKWVAQWCLMEEVWQFGATIKLTRRPSRWAKIIARIIFKVRLKRI